MVLLLLLPAGIQPASDESVSFTAEVDIVPGPTFTEFQPQDDQEAVELLSLGSVYLATNVNGSIGERRIIAITTIGNSIPGATTGGYMPKRRWYHSILPYC